MNQTPGDAVRRFQQSMVMDHEKWHDGIGYDLDILRGASPGDRASIEQILLARGIQDWRDVQALAALDSPRAQALLREALAHGSAEIQAAVLAHAPAVVPEATRIGALVSLLLDGDAQSDVRALLEVQDFHPPEVIDALFRGVLLRDGATAAEFAAMLMYLHGQADSAYDWDHRPFFLRFLDGDRQGLFRELCAKVGVDPANYLDLV